MLACRNIFVGQAEQSAFMSQHVSPLSARPALKCFRSKPKLISSFSSFLFKILNPVIETRSTRLMIYPDLASPSYQPTMMSVRPHHDPYRSLPCTPLGMDPRNLAAMDLAPALNHARMGLEAQDYFSSPRYGGSMRGSSPYPHGMDVESFHNAGAGVGASAYNGDMNPTNLPGLVCR